MPCAMTVTLIFCWNVSYTLASVGSGNRGLPGAGGRGWAKRDAREEHNARTHERTGPTEKLGQHQLPFEWQWPGFRRTRR